MKSNTEVGKIVHKPWGKEVWLELNDKYCYKRIYINAGHRTSYQYHNHKLETNYIISGEAEIWLENDEGEIVKSRMTGGDFFTVNPPKKHRVIAITDIVLQEVSTPEVDDVVRLQDDTGRQDGKIDYEHKRNAACILMAGIGSRMDYLTKFVNKGLLPLDNKAIISHMIDKIPTDYEIVMALGYKQELVKQYCRTAHPDRTFIFVDVGAYIGANTGPAQSIDKCREHLQRPFYLLTADTFIEGDLPPLSNTWLGVSRTGIPELYSTVNVENGIVKSFMNKSSEGYEHAFIGLAAIYDFKTFWNNLEVESGEVVSAFYDVSAYTPFEAKELKWHDLGTIDSYFKARDKFEHTPQYGLVKNNGELLYRINDNLIKLFPNTNDAKGRIKRQSYLSAHTPSLTHTEDNIYAYRFVPGKTLYELDDLDTFTGFLSYAHENLWQLDKYDNMHNDRMLPLGKRFYHDKTFKRLDAFIEERQGLGFLGTHIVNGVETPPIKETLSNFKHWDTLYNGLANCLFHGDLQFDNIVYGEEGYCLIDWRQDFGGCTDFGDVYYDLAKLYGGCLISYSLIKDSSAYTLRRDGSTVSYSYKTTPNLARFKDYYEEWLVANGYSLWRVKVLTALIFLNMAPLHEYKLGNMLFFMSKYLWESVDDK